MDKDEISNELLAEIKAVKNSAKQELDSWQKQLRNAKKGEKYYAEILFPPGINVISFENLSELGLKIIKKNDQPNLFLITGTPNKAGSFEIPFKFLATGYRASLLNNLYYYYKDKISSLIQTHVFTLLVNPDPRDLWKNIPTDENIIYFKKDFDSQLLGANGHILLGASQRGRSHAHTGLPRDDDFCLDYVDGWHILAVADGAGSAKFSRQGSKLACEATLRTCRELLDSHDSLNELFNNINAQTNPTLWKKRAEKYLYHILPASVSEARKAIRAVASENGHQFRDYATTLLIAVTKKFRHGWVVVSFQIGDGAMAMFHADTATLLAEPDEGEFGGQTRFITMDGMMENESLMRRLHIDFVPDLQGICLMTDGVSDAKFSTLANLQEPSLWQELKRELDSIAISADAEDRLLNWLQFWSQGNHDDRTIAILKVSPPRAISQARQIAVPAIWNK